MKRVVVFTDISGLGNCSGSANIAVLSALGVEPLLVPTAILSAQTGFEQSAVFPFTENLGAYIDSLEAIKPHADALYIGFMAGRGQCAHAKRLVRAFPEAALVVDPILGDGGRAFPFYGEMCEDVAALVREADVITPNLTELCLLTGASFSALEGLPETVLFDRIESLCGTLMREKPKTVVVTGVNLGGVIATLTADAHGFSAVKTKRVGGSLSGTGDIMTSVICAAAAKGESIPDAAARAAHFITRVLEGSPDISDRNYGIPFQPYLSELSATE